MLEGVLYPALAGTFGAQSVLFAKSVTEAVRLTAKGDNQLTRPEPYIMALAVGGCVFLQLRYLNVSLTKAGACHGECFLEMLSCACHGDGCGDVVVGLWTRVASAW